MECSKILTARNEERLRLSFPDRPSKVVLAACRAGGHYRKSCGAGGCWYLHDPATTYQLLKAANQHDDALEVAAQIKAAYHQVAQPNGQPPTIHTIRTVKKLD